MIACTPIPTAAAASPPPAPGPQRTGPLRNGNQRGNPNLAPRCGAKNRGGNPCRAPAMRNGRCHLHGGKCTGPRTQEGMANVIAAHTTHGRSTAPARAEQRHIRTLIRRTKLTCDARHLWPYLPPDMAARLAEGPDELFPPVHPPNPPFVTDRDSPPVRTRLQPTPARDRRYTTAAARPLPRTLAAERHTAREEAAALAPWRAAIAFARGAKRAALATRRTERQAKRAAREARRAARQAKRAASAALLPRTELGLLEREFAARMAGLRPGLGTLHRHAATSDANPDSTFPRINPMNPETGQNHRSPFPRINPMNREPTTSVAASPPALHPLPPRPVIPPPHAAPPGQNADSTFPRINPMNPETRQKRHSAFFRINPMNREPDAFFRPAPAPRPASPSPASPRLSPAKAHALRTTTLSGTCHPDLRATLAAQFGPPCRNACA